ncbi:hypothetical protein GE061_010757 [Apolygus lucorum]|uniref:Death domain-containing protein n=1 Tax=Apolygus lucorum TaxID=248454 RepID=A0A8S9XVU5_APOLU|nr:hypothetical protein GE061_010757 [Apolygus lucorum]
MILIFPLFLGAICAATAPHRPVDLHQCSLVKFDLNDLDNALYMYKGCVRLFRSVSNPEKQQSFLTDLQNKMDSAWIKWALESGLDIEGTLSLNGEESDVKKRHRKLDTLMNELAIQAGINREVLTKHQGLLGATSRIRRSLIESIKSKIENVQEDLMDRVSTADKQIADRISHQVQRNTDCNKNDHSDHLELRINATQTIARMISSRNCTALFNQIKDPRQKLRCLRNIRNKMDSAVLEAAIKRSTRKNKREVPPPGLINVEDSLRESLKTLVSILSPKEVPSRGIFRPPPQWRVDLDPNSLFELDSKFDKFRECLLLATKMRPGVRSRYFKIMYAKMENAWHQVPPNLLNKVIKTALTKGRELGLDREELRIKANTPFLHRECLNLMETLADEEKIGLMKLLHEKMDYAWANLASREGHAVVRRALARAVERGMSSDDVAVWAVSSDFGNMENEQRELNSHDYDTPNQTQSQNIMEFVTETYNILIIWSLTSLVVLASLLCCAAYYLFQLSKAFARRVKNKTWERFKPEVRSRYKCKLHQKLDRAWVELPKHLRQDTLNRAVLKADKLGICKYDLRIHKTERGWVPHSDSKETSIHQREDGNNELVLMFSSWWLITLILIIIVLTYLTYVMLRAICHIMHRTSDRLRY